MSSTASNVITLEGIKVVVFDLDDTLYMERSYAFSGFDAVAGWLKERLACPFDPATRMRELFETGDRGKVFDQLVAELPTPASGDWVSEMVVCFRNHEPEIRTCDDVIEALDRWQGGARLALISDGPFEMQQRKVAALGLDRWLDPIILTDRWGRECWKPHPRAFEQVSRATGQAGSSCAYIADNASKDFVAPNQLGWVTVKIHRPGAVHADLPAALGGEPQYLVNSLSSIKLNF